MFSLQIAYFRVLFRVNRLNRARISRVSRSRVRIRVRVSVSVSFRLDVLGLYDLLKYVCEQNSHQSMFQLSVSGVQLVAFDSDQRSVDVHFRSASCCACGGTTGSATAAAARYRSNGSGVAGRRPPTAVGDDACDETPVGGANSGVAEAVDGDVEIGVQVRQHGRVEMDAQRQAVRAVVQQHDDVRAPAAEERHEDDEDGLHLANGLHRCHVSGFGSALQTKPKHRHFGDDSGL